jgi:hypothetical protein
MLYYDARLSQTYPTVEIRVFDATTEIGDIGLIAALSRALVETVAQGSDEVPAWRTDLLRAAHWKASRYGISDRLVHPLTQRPAHARAVVQDTVDHVSEALDSAGDSERVMDGACGSPLPGRAPEPPFSPLRFVRLGADTLSGGRPDERGGGTGVPGVLDSSGWVWLG